MDISCEMFVLEVRTCFPVPWICVEISLPTSLFCLNLPAFVLGKCLCKVWLSLSLPAPSLWIVPGLQSSCSVPCWLRPWVLRLYQAWGNLWRVSAFCFLPSYCFIRRTTPGLLKTSCLKWISLILAGFQVWVGGWGWGRGLSRILGFLAQPDRVVSRQLWKGF